MNENTYPEPDPRHTFLSVTDLQHRYQRGRTFIFELVKTPGFPAPIVPGRWRLLDILAWEDRPRGGQAPATRPTQPAPSGDPASDGPVPPLPAFDDDLAPKRVRMGRAA